jgi:hypothetical protein
MMEAEWLDCTDPTPMLRFLRDSGRASDRKLLLFACACCRRFWHHIEHELGRLAVAVTEKYVDGREEEHVVSLVFNILQQRPVRQLGWAEEAAWVLVHEAAESTPYVAASLPGRAATAPMRAAKRVSEAAAREAGSELAGRARRHLERAARSEQANLLRCIFGHLPFRPFLTLAAASHARKDGTITHLAQTIYDDLAFDQLPTLADTLEAAGCDGAGMLAHCRGPGSHVRGCWAVDLILGKA